MKIKRTSFTGLELWPDENDNEHVALGIEYDCWDTKDQIHQYLIHHKLDYIGAAIVMLRPILTGLTETELREAAEAVVRA